MLLHFLHEKKIVKDILPNFNLHIVFVVLDKKKVDCITILNTKKILVLFSFQFIVHQ